MHLIYFRFFITCVKLFWGWTLFPFKMIHMTKQSSTVRNMSDRVEPSSANPSVKIRDP